MASTVSNGNDRSEKWHRPFQMAMTIYEREICDYEGHAEKAEAKQTEAGKALCTLILYKTMLQRNGK